MFDVILVQSADVQAAESLFKKLTRKELPVYGIMMKGRRQNYVKICFVTNVCS